MVGMKTFSYIILFTLFFLVKNKTLEILNSKFLEYYKIDSTKAGSLFTASTSKTVDGLKKENIFVSTYDPKVIDGSTIILGEWGSGKTYYLEYIKK